MMIKLARLMKVLVTFDYVNNKGHIGQANYLFSKSYDFFGIIYLISQDVALVKQILLHCHLIIIGMWQETMKQWFIHNHTKY